MNHSFSEMLTVGGHANSLGLAEEVVRLVLDDVSRLPELYECLFDTDAWVRMRSADALEKICRVQPGWIEPYIDRLFTEIGQSSQASIQWHFAQILGEVTLLPSQQQQAIDWLSKKLQTTEVDWIVAANSMETLMQFVQNKQYSNTHLIALLKIQQNHHSKSVVKRATKLLADLV